MIDWGWSPETADPVTFRDTVVSQLTEPCPWHTSNTRTSGPHSSGELVVQPRGSQVLLRARMAKASDWELGTQLASRLHHVLGKVREGELALLEDAPAGYRSWLIASTPDPAQAWLDHELTDIILNQGRSAMPRELLENLPAGLLAPSTGPQPESAACNVCSFSAAHGGMLCACGHDWSCHPGNVTEGEPCSHCACPSMQHV
ncbi:hypothetical protein [Streptomyces sp. NPDC093591]|uniref:hypothetical protein n=1 Tax=Streptomyces sp. NPDC093591 TaxID=3366044 RepID=UPI0038055140